MKSLNLLHKNSNPRIKILFKDKANSNNNKFQFISILKGKKKNSTNLFNSNLINKNNYNFNKRNNITINNSINHIVNNITINNNSINHTKNNYQTKHNNSLSKPKESIIQNYKSYMDKKKYNVDICLKKPLNISRNAHNSFTNNINKSFYYLSLNHKIKKNPSFNNNKNNFKNKAINYKLKLFLKIPNNNNLNLQNISNNICSKSKTNNNSIYNFTNNSINENIKKTKNNSKNSTTNHSTNFTKKSFYKKKFSLQKKEKKNNKISINANPSNKNNNKQNISKNNSNNNNKLYGDYILNKMFLKKTKNKNISINLKKYITRGNSNNISNNINNFNNNHSNTNSNIQISQYVNNFLNKTKQLNKNIKEENSKNRIYNSNYDIDEIEKINLYTNTNECDPEEKNEYVNEAEKIKTKELKKDTSLEDTIKFSKCSSKVEEEGELGLDEVKDIIIYYNLNGVKNKDYLFQKNDYIDFEQKRKKKYLNFFLK